MQPPPPSSTENPGYGPEYCVRFIHSLQNVLPFQYKHKHWPLLHIVVNTMYKNCA